MFAGLTVVILTIIALSMCVAGFMANTLRFETKMKLPGFYWTWGMIALMPISFMTGTPWWVRVAGFGVLAATALFWQADRKESSR